MIKPETYKHIENLPHHRQLCGELLQFFAQQEEVSGAFLAGSGATGGMDHYSDLDLGFVCVSESAKEALWAQRFDWPLPPWFHRMDADHVKPYFVIYLFEPDIHVDLVFYTRENLPSQAGGPYKIVFDKTDELEAWAAKVGRPPAAPADWSNVVHEEERFWTWIHYSWCHVGRGEFYDMASEFSFLRSVPEKWFARLRGSEKFTTRRFEQRGETDFAQQMALSFPAPDRESLETALLNLIDIHNHQREAVESLIAPKWKTTPAARDQITKMVRDL